MSSGIIRPNVAKPVVHYLCNQFTKIDGERVQLFAGVLGYLDMAM